MSGNFRRYLNKRDYIPEGYEIRIIEDIVDKYNGYMDIHIGNSEYSVDIILNLNTT